MATESSTLPDDVKQNRALWVEMRSPDGPIWTGMAESITVPSTKGMLGVLPRHAPLMSALDVGRTRVRGGRPAEGCHDVPDPFDLVTGEGFIEVFRNQVLLLVDFGDIADDVDIERAKEARERAKTRLRSCGESVDQARAEAALRRALMRLHYGGRH